MAVVCNQDTLNKPSFNSHILTNLKSGSYRYLSLFMFLALKTVSLTVFLASIHTFHMLSRLCQNLDFSFFLLRLTNKDRRRQCRQQLSEGYGEKVLLSVAV